MKRYILAVMTVLAVSACTDDRHTSSSNNADSASRNDRNLNTGPDATNAPTAGDQSESEGDRRITQEVRKAVIADSTLSMKAKNCTIITINGVVTLRGSVDTAAERLSISNTADRVSGVHRVDNLLMVAR